VARQTYTSFFSVFTYRPTPLLTSNRDYVFFFMVFMFLTNIWSA